MANKITPDRVVNPVTIIAYDGENFWAVKCDEEGNLVIDVGGIEIGEVTIVDGGDATLGAIADAAVAANAAGTLSAKLRRLTADLNALLMDADSIDANIGLIEGNIDTINSEMVTRATGLQFRNVTMVNAKQEYHHDLPNNCQKFLIRCRGPYDIQICRNSGESGLTFLTIPAGMSYWEDLFRMSGKTLYFQCGEPAQVAEIVEWN